MQNQHTMIYAKASLTRNQCEIKKTIGCDGIEIQLLDELFGNNYGEINKISEVYDLGAVEDFNITVVHTPLISSNCWGPYETVTLENSINTLYRKILKKSFKIAEHYGELNNRKILVVVHCDHSLEDIITFQGSLLGIEKMVYDLLDKYPHTVLAIENTTPFYSCKNIRQVLFKNGFGFENVQMARHLRLVLKTNRIGTVLDTCHSMMSSQFYNNVKHYHQGQELDFSMESYFKENADTAYLIHLSNCKGLGFGENHGVPFINATQEFLEIISLYDKYNYQCPITLEVREDDYSTCNNYKQDKKLIDQYNIIL